MRYLSISVAIITTQLILQLTAVPDAMAVEQKEPSKKNPNNRKEQFVDEVVRGGGLMPWQKKGPSPEEVAFRNRIESRKDEMLAHTKSVAHPALLTKEQVAPAKRNIEKTQWGKQWFDRQKEIADYIVAQDGEYIEKMISELTPWHQYGFTCPNCVGDKSQEGVGRKIIEWDYKNPDKIHCKECGQTYPSQDYPETAVLQAPRMGQTLSFYYNDREKAKPDDRTGKLAYHWFGRPMHISFSGNVRWYKAQFMIDAAKKLAVMYQLTDDARYAEKAVAIVSRAAYCYSKWLYHDYWDGLADCDPLYAALHDRELKLEWKRHLCTDQYQKDTSERAAMVQNYWGAGRYYPSTGGMRGLLKLVEAYDLVYEAKDNAGRPLWTNEARTQVERGMILEWILEAGPFLSGGGRESNKAPRIYVAQAAIAKALDVPELADAASTGAQSL